LLDLYSGWILLEYSKEQTLSIHRFIEQTAQEGDLTSSFFSQKRALDGTKGHQKVQKSRKEGYQSEISIKSLYTHQNLALTLEGRIDGILDEGDTRWLEEIKTIESEFPLQWEETPVMHRAQLFCYGAMWFKNHAEKINLRLTYYHLHRRKEQIIDCPLTHEQILEQFQRYLNLFFNQWEQRSEWNEQRNQNATQLDFPFAQFRPGQRDFSVKIFRNFQQQGVILAQAPTGTGKTMGTLFPAVKAWGEGLIEKILYLTAKTTGREMAEEALNLLEKKGMEFTSVTLTAKDRICLSPDSARCHGHDCLYAQGFYDKLHQLFPVFREKKRWSKKEFIELAEEVKICPFELSMEWALEADVVIGDFNHLFDPVVSLKRYFQRSDEIALLIDEAHNLPDRARDLYSARLKKEDILSYRRALKDKYPELGKGLNKINRYFLDLKKELEQQKERHIIQDSLEEKWIRPLRNIITYCENILRDTPPEPYRSLCNQLFFEIRFFLFIADLAEEAHRFIVKIEGKSCSIEYLCLDPSAYITESLKKCQSTAFFSATLHPMDYFSKMLLYEQDCSYVDVPSPFPEENCLVINRKDIDTRFKAREKNMKPLAEAIQIQWEAYRGHQIIFFPSYAYMEQLARQWSQLTDVQPQMQWRKMSLEEREDFLEHFNRKEPQLIFAVMGGVFSEGIDLIGDKLSALMIVSVGFPSFSLERELMRDYFQQKSGRGFDFAYRYPGWHRVLQASGRLIRSEQDKGIITLVGYRFAEPFYQQLYPLQWGRVLQASGKEQQQKWSTEFYNQRQGEKKDDSIQ